MHVAIFSEHFHKNPSGPRLCVIELARAMRSQGAEVSILSLSPRSRTEEIEGVGSAVMRRYSWKLLPVRYGRHRFCARMLSRLHRRKPVDVVLAMGLRAGRGADLFRRRTGVPFVLNPRSRLAHKPGGWKYEMARKLVSECDVFVGLSEFEADGWCHDLGIKRDGRHLAVHNGYNPAALEGDTEPLPGVPDGVPLILCMANLRKAKGQHHVMRALDGMADLPWFAVFAGGGTEPGKSWVREHHASMELRERVLLPGVVTGARWRWLYRNATVFCLTPVYPEAFGNAFLEAQAAGLPVVTSDGGGQVEAVAAHETALVVPRSKSMATGIEAALRRLLTDAALRRQMGEAGKQRAASFTWERAARGYLEALQRACAARRVPAGKLVP
jgi:glycosyltransferase involved in cell wall biosynthesis